MQARDDDEPPRWPAVRGVSQGINTRTGSVASVIWVNRPVSPQAIVFIDIDGEAVRDDGVLGQERDPYREDGGEG